MIEFIMTVLAYAGAAVCTLAIVCVFAAIITFLGPWEGL